MNFNLTKNATPEQVVTKIKEFGIARIPNHTDDVSGIKEELLAIYDKMPPNYQFGKAIRTDLGNLPLNRCPTISKYFNNPWMKEIAATYQLTQAACQSDPYPSSYKFQRDIFSTHDFLHGNGTATQGWVHFDKFQRFKFFLHVTDITEDCGPFQAALKTHILTKELRKKNPKPTAPSKWRFGRFSGDAGMPGPKDDARTPGSQNHYPEIEYELTPMLGPAGTLLIFDSDVLHKGGNVQEGKERIVVRAHSW
jgi:hypothetical protein